MTSINALADNRYAYLTADTAIYDPTSGKVTALGSKVIVLEALSMVIAFSGRWYGLADAIAALDRHCPATLKPNQADILAAIVPAIRELNGRSLADGLATGFAGAAVTATVALYDHERREPRRFYSYAEGAPSRPTPRPFSLDEVPGIVAPAVGPVAEQEIWPAGYLKLPRREFSRLIQMQRQTSVPHVANGCAVGGTCQFFRVGPDGIYADELVAFPEVPGEVLNPALAGEHIASRMDLAFAV